MLKMRKKFQLNYWRCYYFSIIIEDLASCIMEFPCSLSRLCVCVCVQPVLSQQGRFQLGESGGFLVSSDTCFRPVCCEERHTSTPSTYWTRTTAVRPRYGFTNTHFAKNVSEIVYIWISTYFATVKKYVLFSMNIGSMNENWDVLHPPCW